MAFRLTEAQTLELIQEGTVGLLEAAEKFDYKRGVAFSIFASHRIRGRMLDFLQAEYGTQMLSLDGVNSAGLAWSECLVSNEATPFELAERHFLNDKITQALERLPQKEHDASLFYEPETSVALGFGFRCGFLGLLHLEIIQERLEREYDLDLVTTAPSVIYKVHKTNGEVIDLTNPTNLPDPSEIEYMEEPIVNAEIMVTTEFIGAIMDLCQERRGQYLGMEYMEETRALLKYKLPLNEIIYDFFDALKSRSRGYASLDYELCGYERSELVKLDILVNKEEVDALSFIVHADTSYERGRKMCEKLKDEIPRQLFEIPIQAAIGSKIIARETVKAMRKDVLAKCYGGDISRKKKLLEKQKEGKKRMRQVGNVEIPQKAFMSVLKLDEN